MMTLNYHKVWESMNELEMVSSKICSARAILDSAIESLESGNREKTENLMYAADEFLQYYLAEFDDKFKVAWKETVTKLKNQEDDDASFLSKDRNSNFPGENTVCGSNDTSPECRGAWNSFWEDDVIKQDKVVKWQLPVEADPSGEYFITFPDDLLEAANLKEGDNVQWVDQGDGSYLLKKDENNMTHDEMLADGWTMTDDGFWIRGEI